MFTATHLHAMIVHFPIALVLVGFLFEIIGLLSKKTFFQQFSYYLILLAAAGAIASYLTGNAAGEGMEGGTLESAMEAHELSATITLWLIIATAGTRLVLGLFKRNISWLRIASFVLLLAAVGGVARTGYLGGQLVFKHAAGVELGIGNVNNIQPENSSNEEVAGSLENEKEEE